MALTKPETKERARQLRKAETVAEIKLWEALRGRRLAGLKFVRQLAVGPYVADFACREERLIVEVVAPLIRAKVKWRMMRAERHFLKLKAIACCGCGTAMYWAI